MSNDTTPWTDDDAFVWCANAAMSEANAVTIQYDDDGFTVTLVYKVSGGPSAGMTVIAVGTGATIGEAAQRTKERAGFIENGYVDLASRYQAK